MNPHGQNRFCCACLHHGTHVNVFGPEMRAQGIDPLAKARSQTAILENKINAAINALPKLKWDFWR
jgi:hypothetical protein